MHVHTRLALERDAPEDARRELGRARVALEGLAASAELERTAALLVRATPESPAARGA